jgi:hypothetical protein
VLGSRREGLRPPSRATRQLEDVAARIEGGQRRRDLGDLALPLASLVEAVVVPAAPLPPVVVPRGASAVEASLIGQQLIVAHRRIVERHRVSTVSRPMTDATGVSGRGRARR